MKCLCYALQDSENIVEGIERDGEGPGWWWMLASKDDMTAFLNSAAVVACTRSAQDWILRCPVLMGEESMPHQGFVHS